MDKTNNALVENISIRIISSLASYIHKRRTEFSQKEEDEVEIIEIGLEVDSDDVFKIFERILPFFPEEFHGFLINFFQLLDSIENIDNLSSVTPRMRSNQIDSEIEVKNIQPTSYDIAAKTTLLNHIYDIVDLITTDYEKSVALKIEEKDRISKSEFIHLIFLALFHDLGKAIPLMKKYSIGLDASHEKRSFTFCEMFIERYKNDEDIGKDLNKMLKNMKLLADCNVNKLGMKFHSYDKRARTVEANRIREKGLDL